MSEQDKLKYIAEMETDAEKNIRSVVRLDTMPKSIPVYFSKFEIKWLATMVRHCRNDAIGARRREYYGAENYIAGMNELLNRLRRASKSSEPEIKEEE